jgi:hypothetical protein
MLERGAPATDEVEDKYNSRDDQQGVNQSASHVHRKT